jgi:hypothetical protein
MTETTRLPVWLVVVPTLVPAFIAAASAVLAAWLAGARKAARDLDRWRRREETMRLLRWAADKTTSGRDAPPRRRASGRRGGGRGVP